MRNFIKLIVLLIIIQTGFRCQLFGTAAFKIKNSVFQHLSVTQCDSLIQANVNNPDFVLLDVRTPGEYIPVLMLFSKE